MLNLQNPPEEVWRFYREIPSRGRRMVQGVRSPIGRYEERPLVISRVMNLMLNLAFGMSSTDNKSGFVMALRDTMTDVLLTEYPPAFPRFVTVAAHAEGVPAERSGDAVPEPACG